MLNVARFVSLNKRREIATEFSNKVGDILCSQLFQSNELVISKHTVTLSQACMLLWRDWFTGDVDGLWVNSPMLAAVYACVLLELIALGKISCKFQSWTGDGKIRIKVTLIFFIIIDESNTQSCDLKRWIDEENEKFLF